MRSEAGETLREFRRWTARFWSAAAIAAPPLLLLAAASGSSLLRFTGELLLVCYTLPLLLVGLGVRVRQVLRRIGAPVGPCIERRTRA